MPVKKINLANYPPEDSDEFYELPVEEQILFDDSTLFTEEATARPAGKKFMSRITCMQGVAPDYCGGEIEIARYNVPSEIRWHCKKCDQRGIITNFKGTPWDLSQIPEEEAQRIIDEKYGSFYPVDLDLLDFPEADLFPPESINDIKEWLESLSEEELEEFTKKIKEDAEKSGLDFNAFQGGLEPHQLTDLLMSDWTEPGSPLYLSNDLPLDEINEVPFFHNARVMLKELEKAGRFGLTKELENLKRKHVESLVDKFIWKEGYIEKVKEYNKVIDEEDVWPLHIVRVVLDVAGLIQKKKGDYYLVKKRQNLLKDEQAGTLFRHLFNAFFRKINIAYLSNSDPIPVQQDALPFMFFRMQLMTDDWYHIGEVMNNTMLVSAKEEFDRQLRPFMKPEQKFYQKILNPLEMFGLVETRETEKPDYGYSPNQVRKTPLFDRFFEFNDLYKQQPYKP